MSSILIVPGHQLALNKTLPLLLSQVCVRGGTCQSES
jgi:hypothetical protein